jgi:hypothetical protein
MLSEWLQRVSPRNNPVFEGGGDYKASDPENTKITKNKIYPNGITWWWTPPV